VSGRGQPDAASQPESDANANANCNPEPDANCVANSEPVADHVTSAVANCDGDADAASDVHD
jgi:hypothetical protein